MSLARKASGSPVKKSMLEPWFTSRTLCLLPTVLLGGCLLLAASVTTAFATDITGGDIHVTSTVQTEAYGNAGNVIPGVGDTRNVTGNKLTVTDSTISFRAAGGNSSGSGTVSNNTLVINSGTIKYAYAGYAYGTGEANGNTITMNKATVDRGYGGYSQNTNASNNKAIMNGGQGTYIYGAVVNSIGGVFDNTVEITDGIVTGRAAGGVTNGDAVAIGNSIIVKSGNIAELVGGRVASPTTSSQLAESNTVTVLSGTITGDVYGGFVSADGKAINNTVNLKGGTFRKTIHGGYVGGVGDAVTGNVLNVKASGIRAAGLKNFQTINFYIPPRLTGGGLF